MDSIVFHIDADKAGQDIVDTIKAYFGNRRVQITVSVDNTVADALARDQTAEPNYALPYDDIARIADALDRNEPIDVMAEMKKFMDAK